MVKAVSKPTPAQMPPYLDALPTPTWAWGLGHGLTWPTTICALCPLDSRALHANWLLCIRSYVLLWDSSSWYSISSAVGDLDLCADGEKILCIIVHDGPSAYKDGKNM